MKRALSLATVVGLVAGLTVLTALAATAEPSDTCGSADPVSAVQTADGGVICINGTGAADGSVTVAGTPNEADPTQSTGYVAADGNSTNQGPLAGYIGAELNADPALVGCSAGDYEPGGANNVILSAAGPNVDPESPCFPAAPVPEPPPLPV